jgi:hypothetical protein
MVVTTDAKNRIRDLIKNDITSMSLGTDGTDPTESDTDLLAEDATTSQTPEIVVSNKTISITHTLDTATGNGVTFREGGVKMNTTVLLDRFVFPDFDKTADLSLTTIDILRID